MTRTASHAGCSIVVPSAMTRVQNYACSEIKRGSCWKCFSGWHAICLLYSYNSTAIFQLILIVARFSQR